MIKSHEHHVVSNHRSFDCLFHSLCEPTSKKHQNPHYWPFVRAIHRWLVNSPHKGPVTRKKLPFDDVMMDSVTPPEEGLTEPGWHALLMLLEVLGIFTFEHHLLTSCFEHYSCECTKTLDTWPYMELHYWISSYFVNMFWAFQYKILSIGPLDISSNSLGNLLPWKPC